MNHMQVAKIADAIAQMPSFPDDDILGEGYNSETDTFYQRPLAEFMETTWLADEARGLFWRAAVAAYTAAYWTGGIAGPPQNPPMMPISNQPWCPFADEHQPHVQCQECRQ